MSTNASHPLLGGCNNPLMLRNSPFWWQPLLQGTARVLCLNGKSDCVSFCREPLMTSWHLQRKPKVLMLFGPSETLQSPLLSVSPSLPLFQLCWLVPIVELFIPALSSVWNVLLPKIFAWPVPFLSLSSKVILSGLSLLTIYHFTHHPWTLSITLSIVIDNVLIFFIALTLIIRAYVYVFLVCLPLESKLLRAGTLSSSYTLYHLQHCLVESCLAVNTCWN